jgi:hypothetical protein
VINAVSDMLVSIVDSVSYVIGGNQCNALRVENVPAVFPHHLPRLRSGHVKRSYKTQRERLLTSFCEAKIREIESQRQDLVLAYQK